MTYAPGDLVEIIATDHEHYGTRAIVEQIFYGGVYAHVAAIGSVKFNAADLELVTPAHASNAPGSFSNSEPNQFGWYYLAEDRTRVVVGGKEYVRRQDLDETEIAPPTQRTPPTPAVGQIWADDKTPGRQFRIQSVSALHVVVDTFTMDGRLTRIRTDRLGNPSNGYRLIGQTPT